MSGHSKWATTKHKKAVVDAKRGKLFAKLIKKSRSPPVPAAGTRPANPTLYDAIQKARRSARSRTTTSTGLSAAAAAPRAAAPSTRRSRTRVTPPAGSRSWSSA